MRNLRVAFARAFKYPSAILGSLTILLLVGVSIYALVAIPREEAINLWRGGEQIWRHNPKNALPIWANWFRSDKLPVSQNLTLDSENVTVESIDRPQGGVNQIITFNIDFEADEFPQDMVIYFTSVFEDRNPYISMRWITPDGREFRVTEQGIHTDSSYRFKSDASLTRRLGGLSAEDGLFIDPEASDIETNHLVPLNGTYQLVIDSLTFEDGSEITDAQFILHGGVAGWFGTDHLRRDIGIAILWGTPVALSFGLIASLGSSVVSLIIAAVGVWFGGWVDELIQRVTEVALALPFLSILIMVGFFYSRSIWTMLAVTVVLTVFGGAIKTNRAIFLQTKESPYIEAAKAYGASNTRIIFNYMIPRIIPLLIPTLVLGVPTFVFLEATLSVLGLGDPVLPTWGKVIFDARSQGAVYNGHYYWMLEPAVLLVLTGLGFAMLGFALDRIFNPRLREV